jgi:hypothetical protein
MRTLQRALASRVQPLVDSKTPFCEERSTSQALCMSCLGFALRVLYPGAGLLPALPADFKSAHKYAYSTEDLLMYLAGVALDAPRDARSSRIAALIVPESMREELTRISGEVDGIQAAAASRAPAVNGRERPATVDLPRRVLTRRRS